MSIVTTLNITKAAAQNESNKIPTSTKAAAKAQPMAIIRQGLKLIYCSQNRNGIPKNRNKILRFMQIEHLICN